jgi:hypothetical protein
MHRHRNKEEDTSLTGLKRICSDCGLRTFFLTKGNGYKYGSNILRRICSGIFHLLAFTILKRAVAETLIVKR